jgi:uncharacterized protein
MAEQVMVSPCIGVCAMNSETNLCEGCFRTLEEIQGWWDMTPEQQADVMQRLDARQQALFE